MKDLGSISVTQTIETFTKFGSSLGCVSTAT